MRAHCRSEAREDVVVRVRLAVERGEYEALRFSLLRRCELRVLALARVRQSRNRI